jgi:hypothetical protein
MRQAVRRRPEIRTAAAEASGVSAAVRPSGEVAAAGGHRPHRMSAEPEPSSSVGVRSPVTPGAAGHRGGRVRRSAAVADGRRAARGRTLTGDAARVADTRCPQTGHRTGRCPPAERPADMTVEAAAEGPQRFRPDGGNGTGCRTPDLQQDTLLDTRPPAGQRGRTPDRTPEQRTVNPLLALTCYNFLYSSSRPALRAAACGGRPRPATPRPHLGGPCPGVPCCR